MNKDLHQIRILVLVASGANVAVIKAAKDLGYFVITCDNNRENEGHQLADENLFVDVYDAEGIYDRVKDMDLDGVISFVSSHGLSTAAYLNQKLQLPGYSPESLKTLRDKDAFRSFLKKAGLNYPGFEVFNEVDNGSLDSLNLPVIVKPTDMGGSQGITRVHDRSALQAAMEQARRVSKSGSVIVEEFLESDQTINGDCFIYQGEVLFSLVGDYIYDERISRVLPVGTVFPSSYDTDGALEQLERVIQKLKIPNGILNFEAIIKDGVPYLIEINPRPSGNMLWKLLGYKYNLDIAKVFLRLLLDPDSASELKNVRPSSNSFAYQLLYAQEDACFKGFMPDERLQGLIKECTAFYEMGAPVRRLNSLYDRVGVVLLEMKNKEERHYFLNNLNQFLVR